MKFKALLGGVLGAVLFGSAAMAADISPIVVPAPAPIIVPAPVPGFDWSGVYVGASAWMPLLPGGQVGFNVVRGNFVFGAEADAVWTGGLAVGGRVRAGLTLGATDRLLAYAAATALYPLGAPVLVVAGTGGVELGLGSRFSVFAEAGAIGNIGLSVPGGCCGLTFRAGVNFHLGN